jgi:hypothetical protein
MKTQPSRQLAARTAGALFIVADLAGVPAMVLLQHQDDADYLTRAADYRSSIVTGALLVFVMILAMALIPAILYPVLREHSETLALSYVVLRVIESVIILLGALIPLLVLRMSTAFVEAGADPRPLGSALLDQDRWSTPFGDIAWAFSVLVLYAVLHRWRMVPRLITVWGLISAPLFVAGSVLGLLDVGPSGIPTAAALALGLNELVLAVWLIVKGFARSEEHASSTVAVG